MLIFTPVANLGLPENATHACDGTVRGSQREPTQVLGQHAVSTDLTTTVKKKKENKRKMQYQTAYWKVCCKTA